LSKHPTRSKERHAPPSAAPKPGLDTHITDLTVKTKQGLEKHWKVLAGALVLAVAVYGVVEILNSVSEGQEREYHAEIYAGTDGLPEDAEADIGALRTSLADLEGTGAEKSSYKRVVAFLLQRASGEKKNAGLFSFNLSSDDEDDPEAKAKTDRLFTAAADIAAQGALRFADDADVQKWATNVKIRVANEKDKSWLPPKRTYKLSVPGTVPANAVPKAEAPKAEAPKAEAPKAEAPKTE
jgi:hypothetical protein